MKRIVVAAGVLFVTAVFAAGAAPQATDSVPPPDAQLKIEWQLFIGRGEPRWQSNDYLRQKVSVLGDTPITAVEFWGTDMGCPEWTDTLRIYDPAVISVLKSGLLQACMPDVDGGFSLPGRATANSIRFIAAPTNNSKGERVVTEVRYHPWFAILAHGPAFWNALKQMSQAYVRDTRANTVRLSPERVKQIELTYNSSGSGFSVLDTPSAIKEYLAKAKAIDASCYDVTERNRTAFKSVIYFKDKSRMTRFFVVPTEPTSTMSPFAKMLYRYKVQDDG